METHTAMGVLNTCSQDSWVLEDLMVVLLVDTVGHQDKQAFIKQGLQFLLLSQAIILAFMDLQACPLYTDRTHQLPLQLLQDNR